LCLISACVSEENVSLGQLKTSAKSSEKTSIPVLVDNLDIKNAIVSIEAFTCSKSVASQIIDKEADYLFTLKNNNKGLYEQVSHWMKIRKPHFDSEKHIELGSGRIDHTTCYVCENSSSLDDLEGWKGIKSVIMIEACQEKNGITSNENRFYLSSKNERASFFNKAVSNQWKIESTLHWQLDITFLEDRQRVQMNNAPQNMATLRKMSLQLLLKNKNGKSIKTTRNKAAWNNDVLINILKNRPHI
jgi:predicted transposase YbfD/YdcC